jgi:hypothetical protein
MTDLIAQQDSLFEQVSTYASAYRSSIGEHVGPPQSYGDALRAFDGPLLKAVGRRTLSSRT